MRVITPHCHVEINGTQYSVEDERLADKIKSAGFKTTQCPERDIGDNCAQAAHEMYHVTGKLVKDVLNFVEKRHKRYLRKQAMIDGSPFNRGWDLFPNTGA